MSPDGTIQKTYKEAAMELGLLESDEELDQCLSEAAVSFMPQQLCSLFVTILIFGEPAQPEILWEKYKQVMGEDVRHNATFFAAEDMPLQIDNEVLILLSPPSKCF